MSAPAIIDAPRAATLSAHALVWGAAAALIAAAVAIQINFGMMADVAWLIEANEKWLAGGALYRDVLELNPPASLLIYWPAVALARALGLPSEMTVSVFGFALSGGAIALGALILRDVKAAGPQLLLAAIVALTVLPGQSFCERDHLAAVLGSPLLALALARAEGVRVPVLLAILAGLGAGAMSAIKPPYALIGVLLALYQLRRSGWRAVLASPEYYAAAALGLAYVAAVGLLFPAYVENMLPFNLDVYVAVREPLAALVASAGVLALLLIAATAALAVGDALAGPGFVIAALAAAGATVAFFVQGKGWVYQAVPAMMYMTLAAPFALAALPARRLAALFAGGFAAWLAVPMLHSLGFGLLLGVAVGYALDALLSRDRTVSLPRIAPLLLAASIGAASGLCVIECPLTPALEASLASLGPGLKIATISEDEGLAFPLVRRLHATWAMRSHSLIVTAAVRRLISQRRGDASLVARLQPYLDRDRAILLEDIARQRPDALLVGPLASRLHADLIVDPGVKAALADYRRVGVEQRSDYAAELWLRNELVSK